MRAIPVGVIGHVDHGKTQLVKGLTGIDTDRLKEERARGISIVLGFAHLAVPGGEIDLIDMPGHERFVRTMVSGATGIEAVLLVVAANEGVKPQTIEHLEIALLLGIRRGVIAITKCDLVPAADASRVAATVSDLASAAGLRAPVVLTSATARAGLAELARHLGDLVAEEAAHAEHGFFYLPIDRAFVVAGIGTVVTGTLRRGRIAIGDEAEIVPGGRLARVRSLQVHRARIDATGPGRRTAVNLRGVERAALGPGLALASPGMLVPSRWLDAELTLLASAGRPLENNRSARLLFGTSETTGRVRLLDRDLLSPGSTALVQLHSASDIAVPVREPFILRDASPVRTIGGGRILDPSARRRRRGAGGEMRDLQAMLSDSPCEIIASRLERAGYKGMKLDELARLTGYAMSWVRPWLQPIGAALAGDGTVISGACRRELQERLLAGLDEFHRRQPLAAGIIKEALALALPPETASATYEELLSWLFREGRIAHVGGLIARADYRSCALGASDRDTLREIEGAFRRGGFAPPDIAQIVGRDRRRQMALAYLMRAGTLVRTRDRVQQRAIVFHKDAILAARRALAARLSGATGFFVREAGEALGTSRKFSIPLLEHLDAIGFTRRVGDRRYVACQAPADDHHG